MSGLATSRRLPKTRAELCSVALLLVLLAGCCVHRGPRECCPICCPVQVRTSLYENHSPAQIQPAPAAASAQQSSNTSVPAETESSQKIEAPSTQSSNGSDASQGPIVESNEPAKKHTVATTPASSRKNMHRGSTSTQDENPGRPLNSFHDSIHPSNTILLELRPPADQVNEPTGRGLELPAEQKASPLKDLTAGFKSTLELRPGQTAHPTNSSARILFAVPKLHPAGLPSLARIVQVDNGVASSDANRPYTLTVEPPADTNTKPIAPVLDLLRTGRQPEADLDQPNIRR